MPYGRRFPKQENMEIESSRQGEKDCDERDVSAALSKSWFGEDVAMSKLFGLNMELIFRGRPFTPLLSR